MYRINLETLKKWKTKPHRKPLIIRGARQVGKTWLMKEFGKAAFEQTVYLNFDGNATLKSIFTASSDPAQILSGIEIYIGHKISLPDTLLIFDEVQEVPQALSALKYFYEQKPEIPIICAGSLLGIALHEGTSFPVGKVEFLNLYPMTYEEFLLGLGQKTLVDLLHSGQTSLMAGFKEKYIEYLRLYYYIGGMPEAVAQYLETKDLGQVRAIQEQILAAYEQDFSKHAPNHVVPRIRMVWNSLLSQLAKENKKFIYGLLRQGARAKEFEEAILWLSDCGLIHKVSRCTVPELPLKAFEDLKTFKLYVLDVGLLGAMARLQPQVLLEGSTLFTQYKGALTEQYVLQQLLSSQDIQVAYYTNNTNTAEIDFLLDTGASLIPLEVKAEENLRAKSLRAYCDKYKPAIALRTSMSDYRKEDWLTNIPLYAMDSWQRFV